jgi:hypothetical protein
MNQIYLLLLLVVLGVCLQELCSEYAYCFFIFLLCLPIPTGRNHRMLTQDYSEAMHDITSCK